ncbi:MAG: hypothetical protein CMP47_08110 [Rickettsiales bacterium]|nr:hypothetical protein [Rickettsiales bacterium]
MRLKGKIVTWNNDKAFGFIRLLESNKGKDIFVHKSDIGGLSRAPKVGDIITFSHTKDAQGRSRAVNAVILAAKKKEKKNTLKEYNIFVAIAFSIFLLASYAAGKLALEIPLAYLVLSVISVIVYSLDKRASKRDGASRTSEQTLLLLGLVGGWPGAIIAQQLLRHKSSKKSFRRLFWFTVVINIIGLIGYLLYK